MVPPMDNLRIALFAGLATLAVPSSVLADEIHVPGDYPTIQEAIDAALPGWVVLVAPGIYSGPANNNLNFHGKDIELRSVGGPEGTVIDAKSHTGDRAGLVFQSGETPAAIVEGFTITGDVANRFNGSSPTIRDCIFSFHEYSAVRCDYSSVSFSHCTFTDNGISPAAGAGIYCINNSSITVDHCAFLRNNACCGVHGGGIGARASVVVVTNSVFRENAGEGGGGIAADNSSLTVSGCIFERNSTDNFGGGGILCSGSTIAMISNCAFFKNYPESCAGGHYGSALTSLASTVTVNNCSFAANGSCSQIHAAYDGTITLNRSIVALGPGRAVDCIAGGTVTVHCSDVFGNQDGDWVNCIAGQEESKGNFTADPRFCILTFGDLTLNGDSPCLKGNHPEGADCGLIGAFDQGCGATAVESASWGAIKAIYGR